MTYRKYEIAQHVAYGALSKQYSHYSHPSIPCVSKESISFLIFSLDNVCRAIMHPQALMMSRLDDLIVPQVFIVLVLCDMLS